MTDCINCIHGDVLHNEARDVIHGNVIIHQQGTYNTVCHNSGMSISFDKDGDMVDNICKRWEMWQDVQNEGQMTLFPETYDNQFLSEETLERMVVEHFSQCSKWTSLSEDLAIFFVMHGPICKTGEATKILSRLEKEGRLSVLRNPEKTEKGTPTKFMTEGKGKTVSVR